MKLHLDNCNEDAYYGEYYLKEIEKNIIEEYIEKYDRFSYEKNFSNDIDFELLYNLSSIGQNILSWYPFKKNAKVLEVGGRLGNITQLLCEENLEVVCIEPVKYRVEAIAKRCDSYEKLDIYASYLKDFKSNEKFDYIICIGNLEYYNEIFGKEIELKEYLKFLCSRLNEDGRILIAFDNNISMRNLFNTTFSNNLKKNKFFSKKYIQNILNELDLKNEITYYPLPDYKLPNVILSDKSIFEKIVVDKYIPYYIDNTYETFNEKKAINNIIKENADTFKSIANSYLLDVGKTDLLQKYNYISFNNLRKEKYRLITKISDSYVEKQPSVKETTKHYLNIIDNISVLKAEEIEILDYVENETVFSKYINQNVMLESILLQLLEEGKIDEFYMLFDKFIDNILMKSKLQTDYNNTIFEKYDIKIEEDLLRKMKFIKNGFWDMTFFNCFFIENKFYFFDQEWKDYNVPIEYIIFKNIFYSNEFMKYITIEELFDHYNLNDYLDVFYKLDDKIQKEIRDNKIWDFYTKDSKNDVSSLMLHPNELEKYLENINKIIFDKDNEINNCNIRLEESKKIIESQQAIINNLSESLKVKAIRYIKKTFRKEKE